MADGGEDGVHLVAEDPLEEVSAEVAVAFHVADDRLDGGAALEFAFDGGGNAATLSRLEHPERLGRLVAAVPLVDVDPSTSRP